MGIAEEWRINLLSDIFAHEVFPAVGCTEPIACAFACAAAAEQLPGPVERVELSVDPGTFKNGAAVTIPNSGGQRGNAIAAALGAVLAKPELRLEILREVPAGVLTRARELIEAGRLTYRCAEDQAEFRVEVVATGGGSQVRCVLADGHTNITCLEKDGRPVATGVGEADGAGREYREWLKEATLEQVLQAATRLGPEQHAYIQRGIDMNLAIAEKGVDLKRNAYQLQQMMKQGLMADDLFYRVKMKVASALDARMGGLAEPVMTSGGSGNQGVLTFLVPYLVGRDREIELPRIRESIAVSHAVNSYIKRFTGELSVTCGCALAASIAAALGLVYQQAGIDMEKMSFAIDNIVGDLCGIICDGAKSGCSMKIVTGADTALRSAFMALAGYGVSKDDGVIGHSAEESIRNLSKVSLEGMGLVDATVVRILQGKMPRRGMA